MDKPGFSLSDRNKINEKTVQIYVRIMPILRGEFQKMANIGMRAIAEYANVFRKFGKKITKTKAY
jgi:hypothetical protein